MPPACLCPPVLISPPLPCQGPWGERQCALRGLLEPDPQQAPGPPSQHPIVFQVCVMLCDTFFASAWPTGRPPPRAGARPFLSLSRPRAGHRRGAWKTRGRRRGFSRVEGWSERLGQGRALEPPGHGPGRRRERQPLAMAGGRGHGTGRGHEATGVGWEILAGFSIWFSCKAPRRALAMPSVLCASELLHRKPRLDLDGTTPRQRLAVHSEGH